MYLINKYIQNIIYFWPQSPLSTDTSNALESQPETEMVLAAPVDDKIV